MHMLKAIKYLALFGIFFLPFAVFKSFAFPLVFSHVIFIFCVIQLTLFLFLFRAIERGEISIKKSYLTVGLVAYLLILFLTAITGKEFGLSFWSSHLRLTGIVTWLHFVALYIVTSSVFSSKDDWRNVFRALSISSGVLALFIFLGINGLNIDTFAFLERGGSFLGNTSYSAAYLLLVFFVSFLGLSLEDNKKWKIAYMVSMVLIFISPDLLNFKIFLGQVSILEGFKDPMSIVGLGRTSSLVLWFGVGVTALVFLINKIKDKRKALITAGAFLAFLFAVYLFGFISLMKGEGRIYDYYIENSGPVRPTVWLMALEGIKERPFLGYGDGNFKYVYQDHLDTLIIHWENPPWFDRVHNFTLEEFVGHGTLGVLAMLFLFAIILYISFREYIKNPRFYLLFIPFIFFLHFIQLQTFFQVDSTLFLSFLVLAFLAHHEPEKIFKIPLKSKEYIMHAILLVVMIAAFLMFIRKPVIENKLILTIEKTNQRTPRLQMIKKTEGISINPVETLRLSTDKFMNKTAFHAKEIEAAGYFDNVKEEYQFYIDSYEKHLPRYSQNYRYLFEYANFINTAFIFGINELQKGEELSRQALELSKNYPHAYWVLAVNLYYQGNTEESLRYAKEGYDLDPKIEKSKYVYDTLDSYIKMNSKQRPFVYLSDI